MPSCARRFNTALWQVLAFAIMLMIFQRNLLHTVDTDFFASFQRESETLVVGSLVARQLQIDQQGWPLGFMSRDAQFRYAQDVGEAYAMLGDPGPFPDAVYMPYASQIGAQGWFYAALHDLLATDSLAVLQWLACALLALTLLALHALQRRIYTPAYAWAFSLTLVLSPWMAAFARNLFWSPFTWFLPLLSASLLYVARTPMQRLSGYALVFLTFFIKCLCGYEYLSSLTLLACSPFILAPLFGKQGRPQFARASLVFLLCVAAFASALLLHASQRGQTVADGLTAIYQEDVKRRTYADAASFEPAYAASLQASPLPVIATYVRDWYTPVVTGLAGLYFPFLLLLAALALVYGRLSGHPDWRRDAWLLGYMLLIPLSWFVLAKAHSHVHTHMNFVLWYLGFIPALFFVLVNYGRLGANALRPYLKQAG